MTQETEKATKNIKITPKAWKLLKQVTMDMQLKTDDPITYSIVIEAIYNCMKDKKEE